MKLPAEKTMYRALIAKDGSFDGLFFVGVKTTGIFCRPTCSAKKPKRKNVVYFASAKEALLTGFRPCKLCRPMEPRGQTPPAIQKLLASLRDDQPPRLRDADLRKQGMQPSAVRRWFKKNHGLTFQGYLRSLRLGQALGHIVQGEKVIDAAFASGYDSLSGFTDAFKKELGRSPGKSDLESVIQVTRISTALGPMFAAAVKEGICLLEFCDRRSLETQIERIKKIFKAQPFPGDNPHFKKLCEELGSYFAGRLRDFRVPVVLAGTEFQKKAWQALRTIPYGETRSYKKQAQLIGRPTAVRAVARANGDNRISIIIPCHRVIGANSELVGYGGGLWRKKYLLELERKNLPGH